METGGEGRIIQPRLLEYEKEMIRGIGVRVDYSAGEIITGPGECPKRIYLVESGEVEIYRVSGKDRRVVDGVRRPGDLLGLAEAFCGVSAACYAGAVDKVALVSIIRKDFKELLACNPFLLKKILGILAFHVDMPEPRIFRMIFGQVRNDRLQQNSI